MVMGNEGLPPPKQESRLSGFKKWFKRGVSKPMGTEVSPPTQTVNEEILSFEDDKIRPQQANTNSAESIDSPPPNVNDEASISVISEPIPQEPTDSPPLESIKGEALTVDTLSDSNSAELNESSTPSEEGNQPSATSNSDIDTTGSSTESVVHKRKTRTYGGLLPKGSTVQRLHADTKTHVEYGEKTWTTGQTVRDMLQNP